MTIAFLRFDLSEEDDRIHFEQCMKAKGMEFAIWDFAQMMRNIEKHGIDKNLKIATPEDMLHFLRKQFHEMLEENKLRPFD